MARYDTYTRTEEKESYRLEPIERFVGRIARSSIWHRVSVSSYITTVVILALVLHTVIIREYVSPDPLEVEVEELGNPSDAITHIRSSNFVSLSELNDMTSDPELDRFERYAYEHAPILLDDPFLPLLEREDDIPIGVYYNYSVSTFGNTELIHIEYWMYFSDEDVGMSAKDRIARWGHTLDRELIYRLNLLNGDVFGAEYQAPIHELRSFRYPDDGRPMFQVASANHNFRLVPSLELQSLHSPIELIAPVPKYEITSSPATNPDIMALAAQEALLQHGVHMNRYVYVAIDDPAYVLEDPYPAIVNVGVLTQGRWNYLHEKVGYGVVVWGYRLVAIDVGFAPRPGDIEAVTLIVDSRESSDRPGLEVLRVFLYPEPNIQA